MDGLTGVMGEIHELLVRAVHRFRQYRPTSVSAVVHLYSTYRRRLASSGANASSANVLGSGIAMLSKSRPATM